MLRFLLPVIIFILFLLESLFVDLFPPALFGIDRIFIPRFVFVVLIFVAIYYSKWYGFFAGLIFGMLFDVVYTDIIGIYMFSYPLITYIIYNISRLLHNNFFVLVLLSVVGVLSLEWLVYGLNLSFGIAHISIDKFLYNRLFPTLVLNVVFSLLIYYPLRNLLEKIIKISGNEKKI